MLRHPLNPIFLLLSFGNACDIYSTTANNIVGLRGTRLPSLPSIPSALSSLKSEVLKSEVNHLGSDAAINLNDRDLDLEPEDYVLPPRAIVQVNFGTAEDGGAPVVFQFNVDKKPPPLPYPLPLPTPSPQYMGIEVHSPDSKYLLPATALSDGNPPAPSTRSSAARPLSSEDEDDEENA